MLKNAIWIFVLTVVTLVYFLPTFSQMQDLEKTNLDYKLKIEQLKAKNIELIEEKRKLEEDPEYLEKVAREKMGLIKEGEVLYRIKTEDVQK